MTAAAQLSPVDETTQLLTEWSRWARQGHGLGHLLWPSQTPFRRLTGGGVPSALISDPVALAVDDCVSRLIELDEEAGQIIVAYFLAQRNLCRVARELKMSRHKCRARLDGAVAWICGRLDRPHY